MDKMWAGRFSKALDKEADDFNSSIHFDCRMYKQDIIGSIVHAKMLGDKGIITTDEKAEIINGLSGILEDIENGNLPFNMDAEDIHMFIESELTKRIGDAGKKLHTARSRNDQVALDIRMYLMDEAKEISEMLNHTMGVVVDLAKEHTDTIMPGYTHLQKAQPITFAHHTMAYYEMFKRDFLRLSDAIDRTNVMPLGSGALAGTTYPLARKSVADMPGFRDITMNSLDGVSDRDFVLELASCLSIIMMHMSRFSEELILWSSNEFSFVEMDDAFSTGSSIMPQKKNPDVAELIRGKTGRVYGNLMGLLTMMKGIPLAYNKDMQEDKEQIFDSIDTVKLCLPVFCDMISTMKVNKANMYKGAKGGFTNATDAADYLVKKGLPFRDAHAVIGNMVFYCIENNKAIDDLTMDEFKTFSDIIEDDIYDAVSMETCVNDRNVIGGPAKAVTLEAIEKAEKFISEQ